LPVSLIRTPCVTCSFVPAAISTQPTPMHCQDKDRSIMPSPETCNSTVRSQSSRLTNSDNGVGPPFMYRSAVSITDLSLLLPLPTLPMNSLYAWALRRLPPSAKNSNSTAHYRHFTASFSPQIHRAVQQTCAPLSRACCLLAWPICTQNSNSTALGAAITCASRLVNPACC
jgi:hypothetical protein